jgi:hypothetical protein
LRQPPDEGSAHARTSRGVDVTPTHFLVDHVLHHKHRAVAGPGIPLAVYTLYISAVDANALLNQQHALERDRRESMNWNKGFQKIESSVWRSFI